MTEEMIERAVPRSRKGNYTQERLLQAAEQTFGELGYHDASVAEICRRAGVAHGTFYRYFAGKEEIFIRLIEGFEKRLRAQIDTAMEAAETSIDQLLAGYRSILEFIGRYVALYNVLREAEFLQMGIHRRFHSDIAAPLQQALEEGITRGEFRPVDLDTVSYALLGIVEFIALRYLIWEQNGLDEGVLRTIDELVLHGIDTGQPLHPPKDTGRTSEKISPVTPAVPQGGEATRQALLNAAERLFGEAGFYETRISSITYVAGVAQGTFYLYFPNKVAVFAELIREINERFRMEERRAISGLADRREIEREGFRAFFQFISRHRGAYRIVREAEFVDEAVGRWYYQRLAAGYMRGLQRGMEQGEIRRLDPEVLAYSLLGMGHLVGLRQLFIEGHDEMPASVLEALLDFIMHGLLLPA